MTKKLNFIVLMIGIILILPSCKEESITPSSIISGGSTGDYTNLSDWIESYMYTPGLAGVIKFQSAYYKGLGFTVYPGNVKQCYNMDVIDNYAYAGFRNSNGEPFSVENLLINACLLREYADGAYAKCDPNPMDLFFGSGTPNKYYIECLNNSILPDTVRDEVVFTGRPYITNLHRGDTVRKSQGFQVQWTGGVPTGRGKITVDFDGNDTFEDTQSQPAGFYELIDNTGNFTITPERLSAYGMSGGIGPVNRYFDVTVTSYEPVMRTLSNGKKVGVSSYVTTVWLTD